MIDLSIPINLSERDQEFTREIMELGGHHLFNCYQCGTCTGDCPAGSQALYRIRRIMKLCQLGLKEPVLSDDVIWYCTTCHSCSERCPQDAEPSEVIVALRRIAAREGNFAAKSKGIARSITNTGHTVDFDETWEKRRAFVGLPPKPDTALTHPEVVEQLKTIIMKNRDVYKYVEKKEEPKPTETPPQPPAEAGKEEEGGQ